MALFQTLPLELNQWAGNQFIPAPVNWTPRPKPLYEAALAAPSVTGQQTPAQQALGLGDSGFQGGQPGSKDGQGLNAVSPNFASFVGSALTGPTTAFPSFGLQAVTNAISGNPDRAITGLGLRDVVMAAADALGIGGSGTNGGVPGFDPQTGTAPGVGPEVPVTSEPLGPIGGGGAGTNGGVPDISVENDTSDAMYAHGGPVNALIGPNPPGPDDGFAGLDREEFIIKKSAAKHYGKGLLGAINDKKIDKAKLKGLLAAK